jgi:NAD(P)-dependent dehydrogenase (short-subunit alcohol dehydrogenase family)
MGNELTDTVALVTGGGRGIGRAIALALAAAGARVAVSARSADDLNETTRRIQAAGGEALPYPADITDQAQVEKMVGQVRAWAGAPINLLVNNAGIHGAIGALWEVGPRVWWRDIEVNVLGTYLSTWAVLPEMIKARRGRIINLASVAALRPTPHASAYSCSKAAVIRMTDSLADSVGEHGLSVFAIDPGTVRTAITEYIATSADGRRYYPGFAERPDEYWTAPERAGELCVALASGRADALTGRYLTVHDDLDDLVRRADALVEADHLTLRLSGRPELSRRRRGPQPTNGQPANGYRARATPPGPQERREAPAPP